jgi:hypothetical protein
MKRKLEAPWESEAPTEISAPRIPFITQLPTGIPMLVVSYMGPAELARFGNTSREFKELCDTEELWTMFAPRQGFFCQSDAVKVRLLGATCLEPPRRQSFLRSVMPPLLEGILSVDDIRKELRLAGIGCPSQIGSRELMMPARQIPPSAR